MKIQPKLAYRNPCYPTNEMDPNKVYEAIEARNQPDWEARKAIFAGCHLLEEGEYTVVSDDYSGEVIPLED